MGMYTECQEELIRALKAAGCEREPFLSLKRMANSAESRISAVLYEDEQLERSTGKRFFTAEDGRNMRRTKLFSRDITYTVIIGDFTQESAEETYEKFLLKLKKGIYVSGDYVSIDPAEAQWMNEKDHILHAKVAVQIKVLCHGGLYQNTDMARLQDVEVEVQKGK